jgi:3-deoxy-manno-octulosonate cytidylyltransferase (CMP-KDO synthetase)|tara:strand:+ start:358 stop:1125 length:768 start_codon:yes stop_codon:yes gene_type:complete
MKLSSSDFLGIIPARFDSSRLKGKPLMKIGEKTMIEHVYLRASNVLENLVVATDDNGIYDTVKKFGGNVVLTNKDHLNGTSRCLEAIGIWSKEMRRKFNHIINIQGDEPLLHPDHLIKLMDCFKDSKTEFATVAQELNSYKNLPKDKVFLVKDQLDFALYFSRHIIPFIREEEDRNKQNEFYQHIGIYGYTLDALEKFNQLKPSKLEISEKLEQLRWLENGRKIKVGTTIHPSYPVDTLEDLISIRKVYVNKGHL